AGMGVGRAHHHGVGLAGQVDVVAEAALPGDQLRIFLADDGLPDGGEARAFRHRFPPATIAVAGGFLKLFPRQPIVRERESCAHRIALFRGHTRINVDSPNARVTCSVVDTVLTRPSRDSPMSNKQRLTDTIVRNLALPDRGNAIRWDCDVKGFGCRVTAAGARSFVVDYRRKADGLQRRATIGS